MPSRRRIEIQTPHLQKPRSERRRDEKEGDEGDEANGAGFENGAFSHAFHIVRGAELDEIVNRCESLGEARGDEVEVCAVELESGESFGGAVDEGGEVVVVGIMVTPAIAGGGGGGGALLGNLKGGLENGDVIAEDVVGLLESIHELGTGLEGMGICFVDAWLPGIGKVCVVVDFLYCSIEC